MKNEVAYKNQNVYLKINTYLDRASTLQFRPVLLLYRNKSTDIWSKSMGGFYIMITLNWNKLILTTTFSIYYFFLLWRNSHSQVSNLTRHTFHKSIKPECKLKLERTNFMFFWILIILNFIPILICWKKILYLKYFSTQKQQLTLYIYYFSQWQFPLQ